MQLRKQINDSKRQTLDKRNENNKDDIKELERSIERRRNQFNQRVEIGNDVSHSNYLNN